MRLGIHASIRRGFLNALLEAVQLNCKVVQIFPRRPRQAVPTLSESELKELREFRAKHSISPLVVHALYQPNIASANPETLKKSKESLLKEFRFAAQMNAEFFIVHAGSYSAESDIKTGIKTCALTIRNLLETVPTNSKVVIENVPGGGRRIGGTFQELRWLLEEIGLRERIGICFDTAHAFAAGESIQTIQGLENSLNRLEQEVGADALHLFHINDTSAEFNSHKDIHQHIGEGFIGAKVLQWLVKNPKYVHKAGIIETPQNIPSADKNNLTRLMTQ